MATWNDIIKRAFLEIGVLEGGEEPEAHLVTEGLAQLKEMLDHWALEGLLVLGSDQINHVFAPGAGKTLTIGPAANNPTITAPVVPYRINHIQFGSSDRSWPLSALSKDVYLDQQNRYEGVEEPPYAYWYEPNTPVGTLHLDNAPDAGTRLTITSEKYLIDLAAGADDEADLFRGYTLTVRLNLAVLLASSHGVKGGQLSPLTVKGARDGKDVIRTIVFSRSGQSKHEKAALQNSRNFNRGRRVNGDRFNAY